MRTTIRLTTVVLAAGLLTLWAGADRIVRAGTVGMDPYQHQNFPDNSQFPSDYDPTPTHADLWWTNTTKTATMMCGPTAAKNSAVWLSYQGGHPNAKRLRQIKNDQGEWVDPPNHGSLIEEFAELVGQHQGWDWSKGSFPGTTSDDAYVKGKRDYFKKRGVPVTVRLVSKDKISFDEIAKELKAGQDIELSTTKHWFSVVGVKTDKFNDKNDNGIFDDSDEWIRDEGVKGQFDRFLEIHDPWPTGSNDGWKRFYESGGNYYVEGFTERLDSYVIECVVPEPLTVTIWCVLGGLGFAAAYGRRRKAG